MSEDYYLLSEAYVEKSVMRMTLEVNDKKEVVIEREHGVLAEQLVQQMIDRGLERQENPEGGLPKGRNSQRIAEIMSDVPRQDLPCSSLAIRTMIGEQLSISLPRPPLVTT